MKSLLFSMVTLGLLIIGATQVCAQRACPDEKLYDRFKDETILNCNFLTPEPPKEIGNKSLTISLKVRHKGTTLTEPSAIQFSLFWTDTTGGLANRFADSKLLYVLADETRLQIPIKDYKSNFVSRLLIFDTGVVELKFSDLETIAKARKVECRWGSVEVGFTEEGIGRLRELVRVLNDARKGQPETKQEPKPNR